MEQTFLILGLVLSLVLWDLGRRFFGSSTTSRDLRSALEVLGVRVSAERDFTTSEVRRLEQRLIDISRDLAGRAAARPAAVTPFGTIKK